MMIEKTYLKTFITVWVYVFIVSGLAYAVFYNTELNALSIVLSFFLGSTVSVMLMSHHYKTVMKTVEKEPKDLQKVTVRNYVFRYVFYILILTISGFHPNLMLIPVFVGLTSFKIALMITIFIARKEVNNHE